MRLLLKHQENITRSPAVVLGSIVLMFVASPLAVQAHHSTAEYDSNSIVESRGEVVGLIWRNPHVRMTISTAAIDGNDRDWQIEGTDLTRLDRSGLPRDIVKIGDLVTFAGNPSLRTTRRMYITNILLPDGREVSLRTGARPRWAPERFVETSPPVAPATEQVARAADGNIFNKVYAPTRGPRPDWLNDPPLTEEAESGRARYDAVLDDPVLGCVSPGMPRVMTRSGPYAVRFLERDNGDIVQQNEWFEIDRVFHMDGREPGADTPFAPLGYSVGRWDGDTLIVTTTHIDWPYFQLYGLEGVPQSLAMTFVERFTAADRGATIRYDIEATDPAAFTETVRYDQYVTFRWDPALEFLPYDCIEEERQAR
jgi:hypothetical protein